MKKILALLLAVLLLCALGDAHGVLEWTRQNLVVDPFDYVSAYVRYLATGDEDEFAREEKKSYFSWLRGRKKPESGAAE